MKKYTLISVGMCLMCLISISFAGDKRRLPSGVTIPSEPSAQPSERVKEILKARGYDVSVKKPNRFIINNNDGKYGFINDSGEVVIKPVYDKVKDFSEGLAAAKLWWKWGYIDTEDKNYLPFEYAEAGDFQDGVAKVKFYKEEKNSDFLDLANTFLQKSRYFFTEDDYEYALIDKYGNVIVPAKTYNYIGSKSLALEFVSSFDERDLAESGKIFNDGLAYVGKEIKKDTIKFGFIDKTGKLVIDCVYDDVCSFQNGLARVKKNKNGVLLILIINGLSNQNMTLLAHLARV